MKKFYLLLASALLFLMLAPASQACVVSGVVLCDASQNGIITPGDPGIPDVRVVVTNLNGTYSNSVVTASDGSFSLVIPAFDPLGEVRDPLSQTYAETLDPATLPAGSTIVFPPALTNLTLTPTYFIDYAGPDLTNVTYTSGAGTSSNGNWLINSPECQPRNGPALVSGFVFRDANQNGVIDPNDPGIPNVRVIVTNLTASYSNSVVTAADGSFSLLIPAFDPLAADKDPLSQIYGETLDPATLPTGSTIEFPPPLTNITLIPMYFVDYAADLTNVTYTSGAGIAAPTGNWLIKVDPTFFDGATPMNNGTDELSFTNGTLFGVYYPEFFPYVYHVDMGWEYFVDAHDGQASAYFYDFSSGDWWYTSPQLFPYLYDFTLGAWLYYCPDAANAGHYTTNPRYFYNFANTTFITR